jgi:hypothetical protein
MPYAETRDAGTGTEVYTGEVFISEEFFVECGVRSVE